MANNISITNIPSSSISFTNTKSNSIKYSILMIAGGGNSVLSSTAGGGGAGGVLYLESINLVDNITITPGSSHNSSSISNPAFFLGVPQGGNGAYTSTSSTTTIAPTTSGSPSVGNPSNGYTILTFTASGSISFSQAITVNVICIGGGGGGKNGINLWTAQGTYQTRHLAAFQGGNCGSVVKGNNIALSAGQTYTVTVGSGGAGNQNGGSSTFSTVTAAGGNCGSDVNYSPDVQYIGNNLNVTSPSASTTSRTSQTLSNYNYTSPSPESGTSSITTNSQGMINSWSRPNVSSSAYGSGGSGGLYCKGSFDRSVTPANSDGRYIPSDTIVDNVMVDAYHWDGKSGVNGAVIIEYSNSSGSTANIPPEQGSFGGGGNSANTAGGASLSITNTSSYTNTNYTYLYGPGNIYSYGWNGDGGSKIGNIISTGTSGTFFNSTFIYYPLTTNLFAWYRFSDPTNGYIDYTGNGFNLIKIGSNSIVNNANNYGNNYIIGNCLYINASTKDNNCFKTPNIKSCININGNNITLTISFWIYIPDRPSGHTSTCDILSLFCDNPFTKLIYIEYTYGSGNFSVFILSSLTQGTQGFAYLYIRSSYSQWNHVCIVISPTQYKGYINGKLDNTINYNFYYNANVINNINNIYFNIGNTTETNNIYVSTFKMTDLRFYNIILNDTQIADIFLSNIIAVGGYGALSTINTVQTNFKDYLGSGGSGNSLFKSYGKSGSISIYVSYSQQDYSISPVRMFNINNINIINPIKNSPLKTYSLANYFFQNRLSNKPIRSINFRSAFNCITYLPPTSSTIKSTCTYTFTSISSTSFYFTITSSGTFVVPPGGFTNVSILLVGAGGGNTYDFSGSGGGVSYYTGLTMPDGSYSVVVGIPNVTAWNTDNQYYSYYYEPTRYGYNNPQNYAVPKKEGTTSIIINGITYYATAGWGDTSGDMGFGFLPGGKGFGNGPAGSYGNGGRNGYSYIYYFDNNKYSGFDPRNYFTLNLNNYGTTTNPAVITSTETGITIPTYDESKLIGGQGITNNITGTNVVYGSGGCGMIQIVFYNNDSSHDSKIDSFPTIFTTNIANFAQPTPPTGVGKPYSYIYI